jgi:hypothetical protein
VRFAAARVGLDDAVLAGALEDARQHGEDVVDRRWAEASGAGDLARWALAALLPAGSSVWLARPSLVAEVAAERLDAGGLTIDGATGDDLPIDSVGDDHLLGGPASTCSIPRTPVAPATKTFMTAPLVSSAL